MLCQLALVFLCTFSNMKCLNFNIVNLWLQKEPGQQFCHPLLFFVVVRSWNRDGRKSGSRIKIPDPQHCRFCCEIVLKNKFSSYWFAFENRQRTCNCVCRWRHIASAGRAADHTAGQDHRLQGHQLKPEEHRKISRLLLVSFISTVGLFLHRSPG